MHLFCCKTFCSNLSVWGETLSQQNTVSIRTEKGHDNIFSLQKDNIHPFPPNNLSPPKSPNPPSPHHQLPPITNHLKPQFYVLLHLEAKKLNKNAKSREPMFSFYPSYFFVVGKFTQNAPKLGILLYSIQVTNSYMAS